MASARKKQDEKHLKILRELVSLSSNKYCFDCGQRGPTYINMTIGSFVCTSCSGMLRGLTPPHRVKSISMASFTPEEVEMIKSRGNDYCRRIWLGLYDSNHAHESKEEQQIKDFMIAKYEKKRYYLDPSMALKNSDSSGFSSPPTQTQSRTTTPTPSVSIASEVKPLSNLLGAQSKSLTLNIQSSSSTASTTTTATIAPAASGDNMFTPDKSSNEFLADFGSIDPFSSSSQFILSTNTATQPSFANFDNNPIFSASNSLTFGNAMNTDNLPRFNTNRWSMPSSTLTSLSDTFMSPTRKASSVMGVQQQGSFSSVQPPSEDRYAALKDLDSLMKTQQAAAAAAAVEPQHADWTTVSSSNPNWAVNGPGVMGATVYGSPSQSGFLTAQTAGITDMGIHSTVSTANPFSATTTNAWVSAAGTNGVGGSTNTAVGFGANPFRTRPVQSGFSIPNDGSVAWGGIGMNGMPNGQAVNGGLQLPPTATAFPSSQSMNFPAKTWHSPAAANPFMLGASAAPAGHSSNPFL